MSSDQEAWVRYAEALKKSGYDVMVLTSNEYHKLLNQVSSREMISGILDDQKFCGMNIVVDEDS